MWQRSWHSLCTSPIGYLVVVSVAHEVLVAQRTRGHQSCKDEVLPHPRQHLVDVVADLVPLQHLAVERGARTTEPLGLRGLGCLRLADAPHGPHARTETAAPQNAIYRTNPSTNDPPNHQQNYCSMITYN